MQQDQQYLLTVFDDFPLFFFMEDLPIWLHPPLKLEPLIMLLLNLGKQEKKNTPFIQIR